MEKTQEVLDALQNTFSSVEGFGIVLTHIDPYFPAPAEEKGAKLPSIFDIKKERISREEIKRTVLEMTNLTSIYLLMVILSSLVAAVGIMNNNVALIIAAMIIAPLLGLGIGLSYGLVMGDRNFVLMALKTSTLGILIGFVIAVFLGVFLAVDPTIPAIITRTNVGKGGFIVALASGFAGAISVTSELPSTFVGVMIGISLMPPLVTCGLLVGSGDYFLAWGALLIFLVNLTSIYFAALLTFYRAGLEPLEAGKVKSAKKMATRGLAVLSVILGVLFIIDIYQTQLWNFFVQPYVSLMISL